MPGVRAKDNEKFDQTMRRFKRAVEKDGTLAEWKKKERFEPPSKLKQKRIAAAIKRLRKKMQRERKEFEDSGHGGRRGGSSS